MTRRDIVVLLFKWKYSLIGYFLIVVAAVTALVYVLPQQYAATATLLIESNRAPVMRSDVAFGAEELLVLYTEVAIIRSRTVMIDAIERVQSERAEAGNGSEDTAAEPPGPVAQAFTNFDNWLVEIGLREKMPPSERMISGLQDGLKVQPLPNSNVIQIMLRGTNPQWIASMVNAITNSYIAHHLKIFSSPGTSEVYRLQMERVGRELDRLRQELADYKGESAVSALDETMRALVKRQSELTSGLSDGRQTLAELRTRYGPGHTKLILAEQRAEDARIALAETQAALQKLEMQEAEIREMELRIMATEKSYLEYETRHEEQRLHNLANPEVVNVRIIEYASAPAKPNHSRLYYIALGALGGLFISIAIAFIKEYFDHRVTDPELVSRLLGVPTLGSVERA